MFKKILYFLNKNYLLKIEKLQKKNKNIILNFIK